MPRGDITLSVWLQIVFDTYYTCCVGPAPGGGLAMCVAFILALQT